MSQNNSWWQGIVEWIKNVIPSGIAILMSVYHYMRQKLLREEARHDKTQLEKKYLENEIAVGKELDGRPDRDIIDDAIRDGARIRSGKDDA